MSRAKTYNLQDLLRCSKSESRSITKIIFLICFKFSHIYLHIRRGGKWDISFKIDNFRKAQKN
jgi:hypothetical protein